MSQEVGYQFSGVQAQSMSMHDLKLPLLTIGVTLNHALNAHFSVACVVGSCHRTTEGRFPRPPTAVV